MRARARTSCVTELQVPNWLSGELLNHSGPYPTDIHGGGGLPGTYIQTNTTGGKDTERLIHTQERDPQWVPRHGIGNFAPSAAPDMGSQPSSRCWAHSKASNPSIAL